LDGSYIFHTEINIVGNRYMDSLLFISRCKRMDIVAPVVKVERFNRIHNMLYAI